MPRRSRTALSRLFPAQRRLEIIEIIAAGLARMPLAPAIPPTQATGRLGRELARRPQKVIEACAA